VLNVRKLDLENHLVNALADLVGRDAFERSVKFEMLSGREIIEENVMLRTHAELLSKPRHAAEDVPSHQRGLALGWLQQSGQHRYRCCFASSVVSEQCENLTTLHGEGSVFDSH
jgi:hypothetical protein